MADGAQIGLDRTGVPVEWDEVKEQLTQLSTQLGPQTGVVAGAAGRVRQPGRRHLRRQRRLVPQRAARALADRWAAWAIRAPTCSAPFATCRCWSTRCPTATSRSCSSPTTSPRCRRCWPTARQDLDQTLGDAEPGPRSDVKGFLNQNNSGADRPDRQAHRLHPDSDRAQRRHRADPAHHAQRPGELLQHLQPRAGHRRWPAVAAELRQPGSVHLRRHIRRRCVTRTTTSARRSAASAWARCSSASR